MVYSYVQPKTIQELKWDFLVRIGESISTNLGSHAHPIPGRGSSHMHMHTNRGTDEFILFIV